MSARSFGERLASQFEAGRHLCAGIDPHPQLLAAWGEHDDANGAERMGREVVAAAVGVAACVKPQVAFFERFGGAGYIALERVLSEAREAGLMVIADVKRGDIGTSFRAYADAWLRPGSPLEVDAMTVTAYQGFGSLSEALGYVAHDGKGLFVLAATSNPEARMVQAATQPDGQSVAAAMVADAHAWNVEHGAGMPHDRPAVGSLGVVIGATLDLADFDIDVRAARPGPSLPVLAPGFGHQGAEVRDARRIFGTLGSALLANESRSLLAQGPEALPERIARRADAIRQALSG